MLTLKNPNEVRAFVKEHLGATENALKFCNEFIKRRNFPTEHSPSNQNKQKEPTQPTQSTPKKKKSTPVDPSLLGFVTKGPSNNLEDS